MITTRNARPNIARIADRQMIGTGHTETSIQIIQGIVIHADQMDARADAHLILIGLIS